MTEICLRFDHPDRPPLLFREPRRVLRAREVVEVLPALRSAEAEARAGAWVAGYVSYEAAPAFDRAFRVRPGSRLPLLWLGVFDGPETGSSSSGAPGDPASGGTPGADVASAAGCFEVWTSAASEAGFAAAVRRIREWIARGDVYQVNHTIRLRAAAPADDLALYLRLVRAQRGAFGAYLRLEDERVLSASPELFFRRAGTRVMTRPMKGTRPRGLWAAEDDRLAAELQASEKERAENLMIVDLLRNDLGRVARPGSVTVPRLFQVERYPTVLQLTSTIEAEVPPEVGLPELFGALFPCGSVTGAPKIAAMKAIATLEDSPREVYCGAIGFVEPGGDCVFSVGIRTAWLDTDTGRLEYGAGAGVTWDSDAGEEWREVLAKTRVLQAVDEGFDLLETLRLEDGRPLRLEAHLERLFASARWFGFPADATEARGALEEAAAERPTGRWRARLRLRRDGVATVDVDPFPEPAAGPLPVAFATPPVSSRDVLLFHKTSRREPYLLRRAEHPEVFDVILLNERGEATELTRGNLVVELEAVRWTPPVECGLLPGVFRSELVAAGAVRERVLTERDVRRADALWLVNSLREWVPIRLSDPPHRARAPAEVGEGEAPGGYGSEVAETPALGASGVAGRPREA